jgi:hypothetical protein
MMRPCNTTELKMRHCSILGIFEAPVKLGS